MLTPGVVALLTIISLEVVVSASAQWTSNDADCLTTDGSSGQCLAPFKCEHLYETSKPVLCRYSRGYGMRVCCPRPVISSTFLQPADSRKDYYNNEQPLVFPTEHTTEYYRPNYQKPLYKPKDDEFNYRPNPTSDYNRPSYNERPVYNPYTDSTYNSRPNYNERPDSVGFSYKPSRPDFNERPVYSTDSINRPTNNKRPSYVPDYSDASNNFHGRPRPDNGFSNQRPNAFSPEPPGFEFPQGEFPTTRKTTTRPNWAPEQGNREPSSSRKTISERKCEEYSKPVTETFGALPLSLDADVVPLTTQKCDFSAVKLIVGGEASELGEFPHMAALGFRSTYSDNLQWNCGGTLISEEFVLTAAHCVNTSFGQPVTVRLGEYNLASDRDGAHPMDHGVDKIFVHPSYIKSRKYNDIALIRLSRPARLSKWIRPACLTSEAQVGQSPVAIGWGRTDFVGKQSDILMKVPLDIIDNRQCNTFYNGDQMHRTSFNEGITDTMLCAGVLQGGRDTCMGDSGGPLTTSKRENACIHYVIGVTSFGKVCAAPNAPGVYTRVYKYLSWIERTVWPNYK